jgi:hypothetical protein
VTEIILARGHESVQATHKTTLEITKETRLSKSGDCVIAVAANKGLADLSREFREDIRKEKAKLTILFEAGDIVDVVKASGSPQLTLTNPTDMVIRKSNYICNRTLAVKADKAAYDLSRRLVKKLNDSQQGVRITLTVNI